MADPDGVSKRFDPRFSPAFQPGYDPRVHREEPPSVPLREEPRRDWPETRDEFPIFAIPEEPEIEADGVMVDDAEPAPWWRQVNRWIVALWAIGVAFILAGVAVMGFVIDWAGSAQQVGFDYVASILMQSLMSGAPMLIVLGLATLTSTVVILAARWRRTD